MPVLLVLLGGSLGAIGRFAVDPTARLPIAAALVGPELLPAEAFTREAADRMLALV